MSRVSHPQNHSSHRILFSSVRTASGLAPGPNVYPKPYPLSIPRMDRRSARTPIPCISDLEKQVDRTSHQAMNDIDSCADSGSRRSSCMCLRSLMLHHQGQSVARSQLFAQESIEYKTREIAMVSFVHVKHVTLLSNARDQQKRPASPRSAHLLVNATAVGYLRRS
ncbi:hypothetical protein BDV96DRAFT_129363 [Lophiotrema nucula]|uniref:Uncharacterized protein n=1 Tax=Lophiotrema nucula TaxID=690887 RepID=A0A6A5ZRA2_9PLEO|nr:hypothetical protein BDV96DRAFT_129363 [Lophiotrema nucula]